MSTGCEQCYAEKQAGRFSGPGQPYEGLVRKTSQGFRWTGKVRLIEKDLEAPLRWRKPRRIFVNSMSDLFHEHVKDEWIDQIFAVMALAPQHTFQLLTKRVERMHDYCVQDMLPGRMAGAKLLSRFTYHGMTYAGDIAMPLPNVWLGCSIEDQATADERIPWLLKTPAAVRFVSYEPALDAVNFARYLHLGRCQSRGPQPEVYRCGLWEDHAPHPHSALLPTGVPWFGIPALDWLIIGGESGPKARPCNLEWARKAIQQCREAEVAVWMKQIGAKPCIDTSGGNRYDDHTFFKVPHKAGANPAEWPEELRVQQFPQPQHAGVTP